MVMDDVEDGGMPKTNAGSYQNNKTVPAKHRDEQSHFPPDDQIRSIPEKY